MDDYDTMSNEKSYLNKLRAENVHSKCFEIKLNYEWVLRSE